jgi:hypothetical protein
MNERAKKALDALAKSNNDRLTPAAVVEAARPARSPLHDYFNWDDRAAAASYREEQARNLIQSYRYVVTTTPYHISAPMYVRDPSVPAQEQGYISLPRLRTDEELARECIVTEMGRVGAMLRRALEISHALNMRKDIEKLLRQVEQLAGRAQQASV